MLYTPEAVVCEAHVVPPSEVIRIGPLSPAVKQVVVVGQLIA
jgi:hypothetical protein